MRIEGFNPCCLGLAVLAGLGKAGISPVQMFQSLLSWISCIGLDALIYWGELQGFQSLLSWISCIGAAAGWRWRRRHDVSILVVLD